MHTRAVGAVWFGCSLTASPSPRWITKPHTGTRWITKPHTGTDWRLRSDSTVFAMTTAVVVQPFQMRAPLSLLTVSTGQGSLWVKSTPDQSNGVPGGLSPWKRMLFSAVLSNRQSCSPAARISSNVTRIAIRHHGYESVVGTPLPRMLDQSKAGRGGEIKATSKPDPARYTA